MATLITTPMYPINARKLLFLAPLAGLITAFINVSLFFVGSAAGAVPPDFIIQAAGQPLTVVPVIVASFFPALVAGVGLVVLNRLTKNPLRIFTILALAILLISFISPLGIPNAPLGMVIILELMHVVVVGVMVYVFNRYAKA